MRPTTHAKTAPLIRLHKVVRERRVVAAPVINFKIATEVEVAIFAVLARHQLVVTSISVHALVEPTQHHLPLTNAQFVALTLHLFLVDNVHRAIVGKCPTHCVKNVFLLMIALELKVQQPVQAVRVLENH